MSGYCQTCGQLACVCPPNPDGQSKPISELAPATGSVTVERDLFGWLVEYALDLRGEWQWKRNSTKHNNAEMARMDEHIFKALQLRESPNKA